ncbi:LOW QUALITY PROTEIN: hypothetical protein CsSME_00023028 [Camellia sinensis var. sinensis]
MEGRSPDHQKDLNISSPPMVRPIFWGRMCLPFGLLNLQKLMVVGLLMDLAHRELRLPVAWHPLMGTQQNLKGRIQEF